jgi:hypothetical protein
VSDEYIEVAFRQACEYGQLETAQQIAQRGYINNQQMLVALFEACSTGNNSDGKLVDGCSRN